MSSETHDHDAGRVGGPEHDGLEHAGHEIDNYLSGKPFFSRAGGKIFIIWLPMTAVGVLISLFLPHHIFPALLSNQGTDVFETMVFFSILAAPVAAIVYAVGIYSLVAWRPKKHNMSEPPPDGAPQRGDGPLTTIWLVASTALVLVLLVWGITVWSAQQVTHSNTLVVKVIGQQWAWDFQYPGTSVVSHDLMLPVNRPVEFQITSEDITHGFWPVNLGVQVDANPNEVTIIRATPDRMGKFTVRCSQLCGLYHAFMYSPGDVVSSQQFANFLVAQGAKPAAAARLAETQPTISGLSATVAGS